MLLLKVLHFDYGAQPNDEMKLHTRKAGQNKKKKKKKKTVRRNGFLEYSVLFLLLSTTIPLLPSVFQQQQLLVVASSFVSRDHLLFRLFALINILLHNLFN